LRVLVVEDEGLIALLMEDMLGELGCETAVTGSVAEALRWLNEGGEADAALLDVNVAGETVLPVAEALAARGAPFAFATGYGEAPDPRFRDAPLLTKPIGMARLEALLREFGYDAHAH
jgi:CheY-like chemotaxis protein